MKLIILVPFLIFLIQCGGPKISISMATASSIQDKLPVKLLEGEEWKPEKGAEYVKVHFYADQSFSLKKVQVEPCNSFTSTYVAYVNFDEASAQSTEADLTTAEFKAPIQARSVTFNFGKNQNLCLKKVKFFNEENKSYSPVPAEIIEGKVEASETASPEVSYSPMNLFDSKFENAYASIKSGVGVRLVFSFGEKQKIDKIKIWNGYQRSDVHCIKNGRIAEILLEGYDNFSETIKVSDTMGAQVYNLTKSFEGKELRLTVKEIYPGLTEKGIVISELRFGHKERWMAIDYLPKAKSIAQSNQKAFQEASLAAFLNRNLIGAEVAEIPVSGHQDQVTGDTGIIESSEAADVPLSSFWKIRLRSDGTFFMEGSNSRNQENGSEVNSDFYSLGNYEIRKVEAGLLQLRIFGFLRVKSSVNFLDYGDGDCNGCGRDCNKVHNADPNNIEKIFQEFLTLRISDKKLYVTNEKQTNLNFLLLELREE